MDSLGKEEIEAQVKQAEIDMEVDEQYQFKEIEQIRIFPMPFKPELLLHCAVYHKTSHKIIHKDFPDQSQVKELKMLKKNRRRKKRKELEMIIDWEIGVEQSGVKMESFMRQKFSVLILGIILFSPF